MKTETKNKITIASLALLFIAIGLFGSVIIGGNENMLYAAIPTLLASIVTMSFVLTSPIDNVLIKSEQSRVEYAQGEINVKYDIREELVAKEQVEAKKHLIQKLIALGMLEKNSTKEDEEKVLSDLTKAEIDRYMSDFKWMTLTELFDKATASFNERVGTGEFKKLDELKAVYHEVRYK